MSINTAAIGRSYKNDQLPSNINNDFRKFVSAMGPNIIANSIGDSGISNLVNRKPRTPKNRAIPMSNIELLIAKAPMTDKKMIIGIIKIFGTSIIRQKKRIPNKPTSSITPKVTKRPISRRVSTNNTYSPFLIWIILAVMLIERVMAAIPNRANASNKTDLIIH